MCGGATRTRGGERGSVVRCAAAPPLIVRRGRVWLADEHVHHSGADLEWFYRPGAQAWMRPGLSRTRCILTQGDLCSIWGGPGTVTSFQAEDGALIEAAQERGCLRSGGFGTILDAGEQLGERCAKRGWGAARTMARTRGSAVRCAMGPPLMVRKGRVWLTNTYTTICGVGVLVTRGSSLANVVLDWCRRPRHFFGRKRALHRIFRLPADDEGADPRTI
ncbi:hypothetical protein B0H11DRAFT_1246929 [Mycena galericulata]|nr:hypothetical protein B0H11DRAFT_1246929 [Mycena galericulata]